MTLSKSQTELDEEFAAEVKTRLENLGVDFTECRSCGEPILFFKTTKGKWMPTNFDLTSHFSTCPDAKKYRRE